MNQKMGPIEYMASGGLFCFFISLLAGFPFGMAFGGACIGASFLCYMIKAIKK